MAGGVILNQVHPGSGKMLSRTTFTQKKKAWEKMGSLADLGQMILHDDVSGKQIQASYNGMCDKLRRAGRAIFLDKDGNRVFLLKACVLNEVGDWDVDEQGNPRYNPVGGGDEE